MFYYQYFLIVASYTNQYTPNSSRMQTIPIGKKFEVQKFLSFLNS